MATANRLKRNGGVQKRVEKVSFRGPGRSDSRVNRSGLGLYRGSFVIPAPEGDRNDE